MSDETRNPDTYFWFGPEVTAELLQQLTEAGPCRLEVHKVHGKLWLHVVVASNQTATPAPTFRPLDHSNECPPFC